MYGNELTGESGQIASPLYPRTYPNNADYRWTVTVDGDSYVQIHFLDLDIEDLSNCFYDNLKVNDSFHRNSFIWFHLSIRYQCKTSKKRLFSPIINVTDVFIEANREKATVV